MILCISIGIIMASDLLSTSVRQGLQTGAYPPFGASVPSLTPVRVFNDVERLMADLHRSQLPSPQTALESTYRSYARDALQWLQNNGKSLAIGTATGLTALGAALTAPVSVPVIVITLTATAGIIVIGGFYYASLENPPDWFGQRFADGMMDTYRLPSNQTQELYWLPSSVSNGGSLIGDPSDSHDFSIAPSVPTDDRMCVMDEKRGRLVPFSRKEGSFTIIEGVGYRIRILTGEDPQDPLNDNRDVMVELDDGRSFVATFYTPRNIATLMDEKYFWDSSMVIVPDVSKQGITEAVGKIMRDGLLEKAFQPIPSEKG